MGIGEELAAIRKGNLAPVYLVSGTEEYLMNLTRDAFITGALGGMKDEFNFGRFDMETLSVASALEEAESFPFFGDRRLVMVDNPYFLTSEKPKNVPEQDLDWLLSYVKQPADFTVFVIFAPYEKLDQRKKISKVLKKEAKLIDVQPMDEKRTKQYVKEFLAAEEVAIKSEAFELLFQLTGGSLSKIMNELEKLILYTNESRIITKQAVRNLVPKSLEQNIFELNEKVLKKDVQGALDLYADLLLQKEEPIKIIALMISQFRLLLQVKILREKGYQQSEIASVLKVHPYRVKLAAQQERKFDKESLSKAHIGLIESDYKMKTGQADQKLQFELFVLKFAERQKRMSMR
ncbi:DNA polymerase III subunit delta [Atopococcus tabaci]|uniref:DNA polymerase III subunit delta n=1 Tax=Atopococcus tabaci TaxID=269774 RepID=UPI00041CF2E4|nr:DNA polymerase III subunit delta [Atopococcus tabaci]